MSRSRRRLAALPAVLACALIGVTGCVSADDAPSAGEQSATPKYTGGGPAQGPHAPADITYVRSMFVLTTQMLEVTSMASSISDNLDLTRLADTWHENRSAALPRYGDWLAGWAQEMPPLGEKSKIKGILTEKELTDLQDAEGDAFDTAWTAAMASQNALTAKVAKAEVAKGENPQAKQDAQDLLERLTGEAQALKELKPTP